MHSIYSIHILRHILLNSCARHLPDMVELDAPEAYEAVTLKAGTTLTALGSLCQNHDPPSHARGHVNAPLGTSQLSSPAIPRPCGRRRLPAPRAIVETAGSTTAGRSPDRVFATIGMDILA